MPDYSACGASDCPKRKDCARYRMVRNERRQSVLIPTDLGDACENFWDTAGGTPFELHSANHTHPHMETPG